MLGLEALLERRPKALSGGQRQRVAVGRAIVRKPKVFLFDEPLSNLDAKMRVSTRAEISKLHDRLEATMIYVTHDQVEAMTMGDRICVMKDGKIMQVAEPLELYNRPANLFVAGFIGSPPMNFFRGRVESEGGTLVFVETNAKAMPVRIPLDTRLTGLLGGRAGQPVVLGIRPEDIHQSEPTLPRAKGPGAKAVVEVCEPLGSETYLYLNTGATAFIARIPPNVVYPPGTEVTVSFDLEKAHLFDASSEAVLA